MLKQEDKEKIEYINGLSDNKVNTFGESLFLNGEKNANLILVHKKDRDILTSETSQPGVNLDHLLDRVHHIIRKNEILKRQKPFQKFVLIYMKAAAIFLLPLLIA